MNEDLRQIIKQFNEYNYNRYNDNYTYNFSLDNGVNEKIHMLYNKNIANVFLSKELKIIFNLLRKKQNQKKIVKNIVENRIGITSEGFVYENIMDYISMKKIKKIDIPFNIKDSIDIFLKKMYKDNYNSDYENNYKILKQHDFNKEKIMNLQDITICKNNNYSFCISSKILMNNNYESTLEYVLSWLNLNNIRLIEHYYKQKYLIY